MNWEITTKKRVIEVYEKFKGRLSLEELLDVMTTGYVCFSTEEFDIERAKDVIRKHEEKKGG